VDDLEIGLLGDARILIQSKASLTFGTKVKSSPLLSAVKQLKEQIKSGLKAHDYLVIATGEASGTIHILRRALDRRRDSFAGKMSGREETTLNSFEALLQDLTLDQRELLLDRLSILVVDVDDEESGDAGLASEMLDGHVVELDHGRAAFRTLRDAFHKKAVLRSGCDLAQVLRLLGESHFSLVGDAAGSPAERLVAQQTAFERYKSALIDEAKWVDLHVFGIPARSVEALALDRTTLTAETLDDSGIGLELTAALRRRGRMLLIGDPGSGKSTLLRQLVAHHLSRDEAAVFVPLHRLVAIGIDGDPLERMLAAALEDASAEDRPILTQFFNRSAEAGSLLLCLDGLDETRDRRTDVTHRLDRLLKRLHPDCELVLATRSSGYSAARTLGLPEVVMDSFHEATILEDRVLRAIAPNGLGDSEMVAWLEERADALRSFKPVTRTPLSAVVLAVLTGEGAFTAEASRAELMSRMVDRIATSWERKPERTAPISALLDEHEATRMLLRAFDEIANCLLDDPDASLSIVTAAVTAMLKSQWGLAAGRASSVAEESIHFWNEAGMFVISSDALSVTAAITQFAELGAARRLIDLHPSTEDIIRLAERETIIDVLSLACGLDRDFADGAVSACSDVDRLDWLLAIGEGIAEGPTDPQTIARAAHLLMTASGADDRIRAGRLLCALALPSQEQVVVLEWLATNLDPDVAQVMTALAQNQWGDTNARNSLREILWLEAPIEPGPHDGLHVRTDPAFKAYCDAIRLAVRNLDPGDVDAIEQARQRSGIASVRFAQLLERDAAARGILLRPDKMLEAVKFAQQWSQRDPVFEGAFLKLVEMLVGRAQPAELTRNEERRLDELARLMLVLKYKDSPWVALPTALGAAHADLEKLLSLVCGVGDFDIERLAAEAAIVVAELTADQSSEDHVHNVLFDTPGIVRFDRWGSGDDWIAITIDLMGSTQWIATVAGDVLLAVPDRLRKVTAQRLVARAEQLSGWHQMAAGEIATELGGVAVVTHWRNSDSALLRASIARETVRGSDLDLLADLMRDDDDLVREAVARAIDSSPRMSRVP
jgi:hypothetical protein